MATGKTLKIRRIFVSTIYNNLRGVPPKEYPTTGEIKATIGSILPALREQLGEYANFTKRAEELSQKSIDKEIPEDEVKKKIDEYNIEWRKYNREGGNEMVDVMLDDDAFTTLKAQFERENWGKKWVVNIEEFAELMSAFEEAGK